MAETQDCLAKCKDFPCILASASECIPTPNEKVLRPSYGSWESYLTIASHFQLGDKLPLFVPESHVLLFFFMLLGGAFGKTWPLLFH